MYDDQRLLERTRQRLAADQQLANAVSGVVSPSAISAAIATAVREETNGIIGDHDLLRITRKLKEEFAGAGTLDRLLSVPGVTDILVTAPDAVWVDTGQGVQRAEVQFGSDQEVRQLAVKLAARCQRRLDDAQPFVDGYFTSGDRRVRLHAILSPPAVSYTQISLRILGRATISFDQMVATQTIAKDLAELLRQMVLRRVSFVVVGGTGSGKTTLLSALLGEVPAEERMICIEDTPELAPAHPHVVKLVVRPPNVEGTGAITQRTLLRQALRMRPDRVIVGEIRGAEVVDLLSALNTGHSGGAGTLHANSINDVVARFEALGALGGLDREALRAQLRSAVQVILVVSRQDKQRRLTQIGLLSRDLEVLPVWTYQHGRGQAWSRFMELVA